MYVQTCVTFKLSFNVLKSLIFEGLKRAIFQMRMLRLDHCVESWIWALSCAEILIFLADSPFPSFGTFGKNVIFLDFLSFVTKSAKAMQYTFTLKKPKCFSHLRFWRHFEKKKKHTYFTLLTYLALMYILS